MLGRLGNSLEPSIIEYDLSLLRQAAPSTPQWRIMDHCSAVGRIYALYEQFVESILTEWIELRSDNVKYANLPDKMKENYIQGFHHVHGNLHKTRYSHISRSGLIEQFHLALSGSSSYKLHKECLLHHQNNLWWDDLNELFERCGLVNLGEWVNNHPKLLDFFQAQRKIKELSISKIKQLVEYRNEAAHGSVAIEEICGTQELIGILNFIQVFCDCISQLVNTEAIKFMIDCDKAVEIGIISEKFSRNKVVAIIEGAILSVGKEIIIISPKTYCKSSVVSLMDNEVSVDSIVIGKPREVGLVLKDYAAARSKVIIIKK